MNFTASTISVALGLFVGMLVLLEVGRRLGMRRLEEDGDTGRAGGAAVEASVFGLLALMIAFTFSGASNRFENRRTLIVEEANAVGTAWLRIDLLPEASRLEMRQLFRDYLDSRLETYRSFANANEVRKSVGRTAELQKSIWNDALKALATPPLPQATVLLLPALNQMFDITTARMMATLFHQPTIIFVVLVALALLCSLLAGFGMAGSRKQRWIHMIGFAAITATAIYVIFDLEYPRLGLIRVDGADQVLIELRESMN